MDIGSRAEYPAGALSNFTAHYFEIDGIRCTSMEGFLQSLKVKDPLVQAEICQLTGVKAKQRGEEHNSWKIFQKLWWQGREYDRHGQEYQELLDRAYEALFKNENFRKALLATGCEVLVHSIGKSNPRDTVLTEEEFCSRLTELRSRITL